jgi:hypothetical protein
MVTACRFWHYGRLAVVWKCEGGLLLQAFETKISHGMLFVLGYVRATTRHAFCQFSPYAASAEVAYIQAVKLV